MKPSIQDQHNAPAFITNVSTQYQIRIKFLGRYFALPLKELDFRVQANPQGHNLIHMPFLIAGMKQ